jgi:hypothetical protein
MRAWYTYRVDINETSPETTRLRGGRNSDRPCIVQHGRNLTIRTHVAHKDTQVVHRTQSSYGQPCALSNVPAVKRCGMGDRRAYASLILS